MGKKKTTWRSLYDDLCRELEIKNENPDEEDLPDLVSSMQKQLYGQLHQHREQEQQQNRRINEILEVITALAKLDYSLKANVDGTDEHIDALALGINMMGEELKHSTISLSEKEVLLKEIHHRVKNNLQLVCSLLNIQGSYISDPEALARFRETQDRVNSMALIHEKLYTSRNFSGINFGEYLDSIGNYLSSVYNINPDRIRVINKINKDSGVLVLDTALPCGLIMNELLSNAFKYAFPGTREGEIVIVMRCEKRDHKKHYELVIEDNGIGFPESFESENAETLGLQLVHTLVEQIDGVLKVHSAPDQGVSFKITFEQTDHKR